MGRGSWPGTRGWSLWKSSLPPAGLPPSPQGTRGVCHPARDPLGWRRAPGGRTASIRWTRSSLLALSFCSLSRDWNRAFQGRKHPMMLRQWGSCLPASPAPPASRPPSQTSGRGICNLCRAASSLAGGQIPWGPQPGGCLEDALAPRGSQPPTSTSFCCWQCLSRRFPTTQLSLSMSACGCATLPWPCFSSAWCCCGEKDGKAVPCEAGLAAPRGQPRVTWPVGTGYGRQQHTLAPRLSFPPVLLT